MMHGNGRFPLISRVGGFRCGTTEAKCLTSKMGVSLVMFVGRDGFKTSPLHTENDSLRLPWDSNVQGCERGNAIFF